MSEILGCFLDDASKEYTGEYEQYLTAVNAACSFIQNNLEQRITLSEISKKVCLSPRFFHGVFKSVKGITPSEYLLEQRIILAKKLLRLNNSSLSEKDILAMFLKIIPESRRKNIVTKNRLLFDLNK